MGRYQICIRIFIGIFFLLVMLNRGGTIMHISAQGRFDFLDECENLKKHWTLPVNREEVFITDARESFGGYPIPEGQYRFFGRAGSTNYTFMYSNLPSISETWTLEFSARFISLPTLSSLDTAAWRGFNIQIHTGSTKKRYIIGFIDNAIAVLGSVENLIRVDEAVLEDDGKFHTWKILFDSTFTLVIFKDGMEIARFTKVSGTSSSETTPKVGFGSVPLDVKEGNLDVYLDHIGFVDKKGLSSLNLVQGKIVEVNLPGLVETGPFQMTIKVEDMEDKSFLDKAYGFLQKLRGVTEEDIWKKIGVDVTLCTKDGRRINIGSQDSLEETFTYLTVDASNLEAGDYTMMVDLLSKSEDLLVKIHTVQKPIHLAKSIHISSKTNALEGPLNLEPGDVYLVTDLSYCTSSSIFSTKEEKGKWRIRPYTWKGLQDGGIMLSTVSKSSEVTLPIDLKGYYAIYVGYQSDSTSISWRFNDESEFKTMDFSEPDILIGNQRLVKIKEAFLEATDVSNRSFIFKLSSEGRLNIAYFKFLTLNNEQIAIASKEDEGMEVKRVIYNNDGYSSFFNGGTTVYNEVERYRGKDAEQLDWCLLVSGTLNYDTKVADVYGRNITEFPRRGDKQVAEWIDSDIKSGKDPLTRAVEKAREIGIKIFISYRMNAYYGKDFEKVLNGSFWWNNPHLRIDLGGTYSQNLSYAYPEVRDFVLSILMEAVEYGVDGINLDFLRHPPFFGYERVLINGFMSKYGKDPRGNISDEDREKWWRYRAELMTEFLRELRSRLDILETRSGKYIQISARVDHARYLEHGLDVETWVKEGLVDILIPSRHGHDLPYGFSIEEFVKMATGTKTRIYGGITHTLSGHDLTPEEDAILARGGKVERSATAMDGRMYRERAVEFYRQGAHGIYIFNNWRGTGVLNEEPLLSHRFSLEKWYEFARPTENIQSIIEFKD